VRRAAYATFVGSAEELTKLMVAHPTMESPPAPATPIGESLGRTVGSVDRTYTAVLLAGSEEATVKANDVRQKAWRIHNWVHARRPEVPDFGELGALTGDYATACDAFSELARSELA
jgi:hypothetical protein